MIMYFKYTFFVDVSLVLLIYTDINFKKVLSSLHVINLFGLERAAILFSFLGKFFPVFFFSCETNLICGSSVKVLAFWCQRKNKVLSALFF